MNCQLYCYKKDNLGIIKLNDNDIIDEVDFFTLIIETDIELENHYILITDIPIKLVLISKSKERFLYTFDEVSVRNYFYSQDFTKVYEIYKGSFQLEEFNINTIFFKIFINYPIGLCEIILYNDKHEHLTSFLINIKSQKIHSGDFESLVDYVESKGSSIWAKYSLIKHQAESFNDVDRLDWLLIFCENFINEFNTKYLPYFSYDKINVLKNYTELESFNQDTLVSEDTILWLMNNLSSLTPTSSYDVNKIVIKNRPYLPVDILASKIKESTDNPENRFVHGFIDEILSFISEVRNIYTKEIALCNKEKFDDVVMYYVYNRKLKVVQKLTTLIQGIKQNLDEHIPVSFSNIEYTHLNKIQSKEHYLYVYDQTLQWLLYKGSSYYLNNKYFKGISRLDELFERACYYLIIDTIIELGYKPSFESSYNENDINNRISFHKNKQKITLHYQNIPNALVTVKRSSGQLKPDFIIEFDDETYIILDSKYKKLLNIEKFDYPDLTLKYLHGMGPKNGGAFQTLGLIVLYPEKESTRSFYQNKDYTINGITPILPVIGSIGVRFNKPDSNLKVTLRELLSIKHSL